MAGAGAARDLALRGAVGGAGREGRLRLGHHRPLLEADPRRPALPRAVRLRSRARVADRARAPGAAGAAPGATAAVPGADLPRVVARAHQGPHRPDALRLADAGPRPRALPRAARRSTRSASSPASAPRICAAPATTSTTCSLYPGAALPGERAVGLPSRRARVQLRPGRGGAARRRRPADRRPRARPPQRHAWPRWAPGSSSTPRGRGSTTCARWRGVRDRGAHVLRRTKGIHCLLPRMTERAIYHSTRDDRMIFVIPWREFSLVGTTDTDFDGDLDRVHATARRGRLPARRGPSRGARPARRGRARSSTPTRACARSRSRRAGAPPTCRAPTRSCEEAGGRFLSITGTKLTCFRSLAEELGDRVCRVLGRPAPRRTARLTLDGADEEVGARGGAHLARRLRRRAPPAALPRETLETLVTLVRPQLSPGDGAGRQGDGRRRAAVSVEPRRRRPAPPRGARGADGVAAGLPAAPHRHRHQPLPGR